MNTATTDIPREKLWSGSFWAACGANFMMFFAFYMLLPILPIYLADRFAASESTIGMILASYTVMALLFRPFAGFMVDSFPRKMLLMVCYTIYIAFFGGYLLAGSLALLAVLRAFHGTAFGMVTVSVNTIAIDVMPSARRGEGIGYFGVSTNLAMAIGPMVSLLIFDATKNYDAIFAAACAAGILGLVSASLIKTPPKDRVARPEQGKQPVSLDRFLLIKGIPNAVATMFLSFIYGVITTYVAIYGEKEVGLDGGTGNFFICMAVGLIVARLSSGRLMNRGYLTGIARIGIAILIVSSLLFLIKSPWTFYGCGIAIGIGYGLLCPCLQTMYINLAEHNQRGTANATYLTAWDIGIGSGVLLGGTIAQHAGNYTTAFFWGTVTLAVGMLIFTFWSVPFFKKNKLR